MGLQPDTLVFDCAAPIAVATFWAAALGYELDPTSAEDDAFIGDPSGRTAGIFFQEVPESKVVKNRVHLDLRPGDSMEAHVGRMRDVGATTLRYVEQNQFWTVMADVEGNEFCVLMGRRTAPRSTER